MTRNEDTKVFVSWFVVTKDADPNAFPYGSGPYIDREDAEGKRRDFDRWFPEEAPHHVMKKTRVTHTVIEKEIVEEEE